MLRKIGIVIVVIVALLVVVGLAKNTIVRKALSTGLKAVTGLNSQMESMNVGVFNTLIGIKGLQVLNPEGFTDKVMLDIPEIYIDYDLGSFFKGKAHFEELRFNLKELIIARNDKGQLNLDSLKTAGAKKEKAPQESKEKAGMPEIKIDTLALKIGKVTYKDYSVSKPARVTEFTVNIDEKFRDITDPSALVSLVLVKALSRAGIAGLVDFDLGPMKEEVSASLEQAQAAAKQAAGEARQKAKQLEETVKGSVEEVTRDLKDMLPFGK